MKPIRYGIVGVGFVGPHHVEAVRRLGFVDIVAVADASLEIARRKADQLRVPRAYASFQELVADPEIDVVDIATPTWLHHPVAMAAIAKGKHVIVDKPMAVTSAQAREMRDAALAAGVVNAVTFNYRYHPMVQQARVMIARGDIGAVRFIHGQYLQEWLLYETDFSWRLEPDKAGAACVIGDAGAHWFDLAQHLTGQRIASVLADLHTAIKVRKKPLGQWREAFSADTGGKTEDFPVRVDDLSNLLVRFDNGAVGNFFASQVCAGHKNDLRIEINGSKESIAWVQERPEELWLGRRGAPNCTLLKEPETLAPEARQYAALPGGHGEGWPDAFKNLMRNVLTFIAEGRDPATADGVQFARFEEGYRVACIVDAILKSQRAGSRWVDVDYETKT
jgi:predicted dehydrogenase